MRDVEKIRPARGFAAMSGRPGFQDVDIVAVGFCISRAVELSRR